MLTRWTVRVALGLYAGRLAVACLDRSGSHGRFARALSTLGVFAFVAHVAAAFHYFHHWSHHEAYEATALETAAVTGWKSGVGLWLNYLFTAAWLAETAVWWQRPTACWPGPRGVSIALHGTMLFMIVNATVVFEDGATRTVSAALLLMLGLLAGWRLLYRETPQALNKRN